MLHALLSSRLYCRFWNCTKSIACASRGLSPPVGNCTLPRRTCTICIYLTLFFPSCQLQHTHIRASYSSLAPFAKPHLRCSPLLRSSFLLITRRWFRVFVYCRNHHSSHAPFAKPHLRCSPLLRSSFLLMKRCSLRTFMRPDLHASMQSVPKKLRVNCELKYTMNTGFLQGFQHILSAFPISFSMA